MPDNGELVIKTLRDLCKVVVGRTTQTPFASINKVLRSHSEEYVVEAKKASRFPSETKREVVFETRSLKLVPSTTRSLMLGFPTTLKDVIKTVVRLDAMAEVDYKLGGGGIRAQDPSGEF